MYVSVRPERVAEVNAGTRDQWILETCVSTKDRIEAVMEAMKMTQSNSHDLRKLGYSKELSEGIVTALKSYENLDVDKYLTLIHESLQYLRPNDEKLPDLKLEDKPKKTEDKEEIPNAVELDKEELEKTTVETDDKSSDSEETENTVLGINR